MKRYTVAYLIAGFLCAVAVNVAAESDCAVPAKSLSPQISDFCFLQYETDDIANPGVQSCIEAFTRFSDSCQNRRNLKAMRCHLLQMGELNKNISIEDCVGSMKTEGNFVQGCEYPFGEECTKKVEEAASK